MQFKNKKAMPEIQIIHPYNVQWSFSTDILKVQLPTLIFWIWCEVPYSGMMDTLIVDCFFAILGRKLGKFIEMHIELKQITYLTLISTFSPGFTSFFRLEIGELNLGNDKISDFDPSTTLL